MAAAADPAAGQERLTVGLVRGLHGLRGGVRIEVLTDDPTRFAPGSTVITADSGRRLTVADVHDDKPPGLIVHFREVPDRSAADALRNVYLEVPRPARTDGWYWHEIIGCAVTSTTGDELGTVDDIFRVGESEVYVVHGARGEILVPAVRAVVTELAPAEKRMIVDAVALGLEATG